MTPSVKTSRERGAIPRGNPTKERVLELLAGFFCLRGKDAAALLRNREITESCLMPDEPEGALRF
jgi:hypothetical protein